MNRQQFLDQLAAELISLAPEERDEAMKFYVEYLDEAGPEKEEEVLNELGSPQKVAAIIRANLGGSNAAPEKEKVPQPELTLKGPDWSRKTSGQAGPAPQSGNAAQRTQNNNRVLLVLLLVFTSPLWIGILGGLFGAALGLAGGVLGVIIGGVSAVVGGAIALVVSLFFLVSNPADGMVCIALSMASIALGILVTSGCVWAARRFVPWAVNLVSRLIRTVAGKVGW